MHSFKHSLQLILAAGGHSFEVVCGMPIFQSIKGALPPIGRARDVRRLPPPVLSGANEAKLGTTLNLKENRGRFYPG
jgi:hypothetical protein